MNMRLMAASVAGIFALTAPATAFAPGVGVGSGQFAIQLVGYVPVICRASVDSSFVSPSAGTVSLGALKEFCNSPNGYRVHADYSPSLSRAKLIVGGKPVPLGKDGTSVISQSNRAAITSQELALDLPKGVEAGAISFRIQPL
ncbi:MAG: hypothetical protein ACK442_10650 [Novosphingobium sp.]|jgi:hypothetical protein|nr:hypothetical protein [Novosphingobium sp.]